MAGNFYDGTEAELYTGSATFSSVIGTTPTNYGLTAEQGTAYASANLIFADAYQIAIEPATRTSGVIAAKNAAKASLLALARELAGIIKAYPPITAQNLIDLGLHVPKERTPTPPPDVRPGMDVVSVVGRTVTVHVHDSASSVKRAKPAGAAAGWVYCFVGETYPSDPSYWIFQGAATKGKFAFTLSDTVPSGATVWICAAWANRKGETGPVSVPISTNIQGGGTNPATAGLKIAA